MKTRSPSFDGIHRWLPGITTVRTYQREWLSRDFVAGLVLIALLVPQGMAYAELAGLPPVNGLYASMIPLLAYALLGPSRILVLAPDSAIAPMVAAAVIPHGGADMSERVAIAGVLAILVGIICLTGAALGAGFLTDLISRPVRLGYLAGIALTVMVSQVPTLFGIDGGGERLLPAVRTIAGEIRNFDATTLFIGASCLIVLLGLRRVSHTIPAALVVVVGAIVVKRSAGLDVDVVGSLPSGLPSLVVPHPRTASIEELVLAAAAISVIAFADTSILSRSYARRLNDKVDSNQELRALGGANLATGLFQGFPISSSSSRTPVAEQSGAKTQLTGVIGAIGLGAVLLFFGSVFRDLPTAALAAILIAAAIGLVDVGEFRRLWDVYRPDCFLALAAFVGVSIAGVLWGIGFAIALSIAAFLWRSWHPHIAVLGRAPGVKGYHDLTRYTDANQIPGLLLFRFDAPIFFANAELFRESVLKAVVAESPVRRIVIAAEPITDLDSTAADMLASLDRELTERGIELEFAELRDPMKDRLR
ncbi:MAG: sulfate permease, partial [Thermomicrobiales bacterium]|nr:sulfate permease [Thermomicrobiales bacterium]